MVRGGGINSIDDLTGDIILYYYDGSVTRYNYSIAIDNFTLFEQDRGAQTILYKNKEYNGELYDIIFQNTVVPLFEYSSISFSITSSINFDIIANKYKFDELIEAYNKLDTTTYGVYYRYGDANILDVTIIFKGNTYRYLFVQNKEIELG